MSHVSILVRALLLLLLFAAAATAEGESRLGTLVRWYLVETSPAKEEQYLAEIVRLTGFHEPGRRLEAVRAVAAAIRAGEHFRYPDRPELKKGGPAPRFRLERGRVVPIEEAAGDFAELRLPDGYTPAQPYALVMDLGRCSVAAPDGAVHLVIRPRTDPDRRAGPEDAWRVESLVMSLLAHVVEIVRIAPGAVFLRAEGEYAALAWYIALHNPDRFAGVLGAQGFWRDGAPLAANGANFLALAIDKRRGDPLFAPFVAALRMHRPDHMALRPPERGAATDLLPDIARWWAAAGRRVPPRKLVLLADRNTRVRSFWLEMAPVSRSQRKARVGPRWTHSGLARPGRIEAEVKDGNLIEVTTERVRAFTVFLNEELIDPRNPVVRFRINGRTPESKVVEFELDPLLRDYKQRRDPGLLYAARIVFRGR